MINKTATDSVKAPVVVRELGNEPIARIVLENRQQLRELLENLLDGGARCVVLDMSVCQYVDSSGCGVLLTLSKKARELGGRLVLAELTSDVKTLFRLTKLDELFVISSSVDRALADEGHRV